MSGSVLRTAVLTALGAFGGTLVSQDALAEGMRCKDRLISNGDTTQAVRSKCGAPQAKTHRTETEVVRRRVVVPCRTAVGGGVCVEEQEHSITHDIETWTYDFGPSRLIHYATFVDGALRDVETGGYGTNPQEEE